MIPLVLATLFALPVYAYQLALKDGRIVRFQRYRVADDKLYYIADHGKEASVPLASIDMDRTRQLNAAETPPLQLPDLAAPSPSSNSNIQPSLGEVARKLRKKELTVTKHVFTSDDFQPGSVELQTATPSDPQDQAALMERVRSALHSMQMETERQAVQDALGKDLREISFPERSHWEARFLAARQRYLSSMEQCLSNRRSEFEASRVACSKVNSAQYEFESLSQEGRKLAAEWKAR